MSYQDDADILAAAREGFLEEADEVLRQFEEALLIMESDPSDAENLNAAFRAAHTIKGTSGLFGCDAVVAFTHEAETLLEALRSGQRQVDPVVIAKLLEARDQIAALLVEVRSGESDPEVEARSRLLGAQLRALLTGDDVADVQAAPAAEPAASAADAPAEPDVVACWHISLRFGADALRNGLDPIAFIRYLGTLGQMRALNTLWPAVPALEEMDAEACYLGFEIRFESPASRADIERVFEFAVDDCDIVILAPGSTPAQFEDLLTKRSQDDPVARAALFALWREQGLRLPVRSDSELIEGPAAAPEAEATPLLVPRIERRAPDEAVRTTRRSGEGDRRTQGRDRRAGDNTRFVRVRADKLDKLIDLIGELVVAVSGAQMVAHEEASTAFAESTQRMADLVQEARDGTLALRMVPIGETFGRFQRVVHDISHQIGKDVELVVTGGETELDKAMVDVIADPLMHLVRNSLDHGLETSEVRVANGKPGVGTLALNAYHEAGNIVIEVIDDGKGLDRDRILAKATERGLVAPDQELTDAEVWQLIFLPGFSTAEQVTDLSGRGVGMDVVKRNIESLRGKIALESRPGQGTTTRIRLPLTLAMIDGFLTQVGSVHYVLPLAVVAECIDVPPDCAAQFKDHPERVSGTFDLRGEVVPFLDLARFYSLKPADVRRRSLVVVRDGEVRLGIVVDRLMGEHQTVIKPLSNIFSPLKALAGSTILGSGDVALVLDVHGLLTSAAKPSFGMFSSSTH